MKRMVSLLLFIAVAAGTTTAGAGQYGYVGLFADDGHTTWCATGAGFYPVTVWVWVLPGENGMMCIEHDMAYPANVIKSTITANCALINCIELAPGIAPTYYTACFLQCRYDWAWTYNQMLWVVDATPTYVEIVEHPVAEAYQAASCLPGYPVEPVTRFTRLYLNTDPLACPAIGVTATSWGAIKGLFR